MAGTLIGQNVTLKVSTYVDANGTSSSSSPTTLYTAPSTGYAILNVYCEAFTGDGALRISGKNVVKFTAAGQSAQGIYVAAGKVVQAFSTNVTGVNITVTGVVFINSP